MATMEEPKRRKDGVREESSEMDGENELVRKDHFGFQIKVEREEFH